MTIYYLYVKTHNITGLKYLGYTGRKDPHKYRGSGVYWLHHLNKHGYNYSTTIIKECEHKAMVQFWGAHYSELWNVVESDEWANLKPETGDGGGVTGRKPSIETIEKISRAKKGKASRPSGTYRHSAETIAKMKQSAKTRVLPPPTPEAIANRAAGNTGKKRKPFSEAWKQKMSEAAKKRWTDEHRKERSKAIKGKRWITNGVKNIMIAASDPVPEGFRFGKTQRSSVL